MKTSSKKNIGHSVFQRLLNIAKNKGVDFNLLLIRYGIERFLFRLSISPYVNEFVLKGANLFLVWKVENYRVTKDTDLLKLGSADANRIKEIFKEICKIDYSQDGISFNYSTIKVIPIRDFQGLEGLRVILKGKLHHAVIPLQIDIGFGDVVTPRIKTINFPTLLGFPQPRIKAYSRYTVIAEKFEAIVRLGIVNSRMKDFYDIWLMCKLFKFDGRILREAILNTFKRRTTKLSHDVPIAFREEFQKDNQKQIQWRAFIQKINKTSDVPKELNLVIQALIKFLMPIVDSIINNTPFEKTWSPGGPWK